MYADDTVWHEAMIGLVVGEEEAYIYTPDHDLYRECLGCKGVHGPSGSGEVEFSGSLMTAMRWCWLVTVMLKMNVWYAKPAGLWPKSPEATSAKARKKP